MRKFFALLLIGVPALLAGNLMVFLIWIYFHALTTGNAELAHAAAVPAGLAIAGLLALMVFLGLLLLTGKDGE